MLYPVAIEVGSEHQAFGLVVPDFQGCFSAGDSIEEALANIKEAIMAHIEVLAEDGVLPPKASSLDDLVANPEYAGWVWAVVDVDMLP